MSRLEEKSTLYCSFCGKSNHETRKMIAGPTVFICDECVELCMDIVREEHKLPAQLLDSIPEYLLQLLGEMEVSSIPDLLAAGGLPLERHTAPVSGRELVEAVLSGATKALVELDMTPQRLVAIQSLEQEIQLQSNEMQKQYNLVLGPMQAKLEALRRGAPMGGAEVDELPLVEEPLPRHIKGLTTSSAAKTTKN